MAEKIDDISVEYIENDQLVVKQLEKHILSKGSWTTIMFLIQELDKNSGQFGTPKATIRRYQKRGGVYRQQSKFNISSAKQGNEIAEILQKWFSGDYIPESEEKAEEEA
jgi:hypothetical protein